MTAAARLLSQRLADVADVHMRDMLAAAPILSRLSPEFTRNLLTDARSLQHELAGAPARETLAGVMSDGMAAWMTREHQFVELAQHDRKALSAHYRRLIDELATRLAQDDPCSAIEKVLEDHHVRLQSWLTAVLENAGALDAARSGAEIVCAEYSPIIQLRVLGLGDARLADPVLDLGCGEAGLLVRHLRSAGQVQVEGIDQDASSANGLTRCSWFDVLLPASSLGTIIAHQSFTLHFLHAHIASAERAARFAQRYMDILHALKPGGCFAYAPSLPFIEQLLDADRFSVSTRAISLPRGRSMPPGLLAALEGHPLGSTIVTRQK